MSVIAFPDNLAISKFSWEQIRMDMAFSSVMGSQSVEVNVPLWGCSISGVPTKHAESGAWQALMLSLKGQINQLSMWNAGRPQPLGTMRGTMIANGAHAQGATTLNIIAGTEAGKTLKQGDFVGFGSGLTQQVVMVIADATADGLGQISAQIQPALRNNLADSAAITWDKPRVLFRRRNSGSGWDYAPIVVGGFTLDLIEDVRP